MSPIDLTIEEAGRALRDGQFTAVDLTQAHLARIRSHDPVYRAFITVTAERALDDAARADRELAAGLDRGPLHGIPIGFKDMIDTEGVRTTCGSRLFIDRVPLADAAVVARLKAAGAVLLGKLMTYEFAIVGPSYDLPFPPATNPWNPCHVTGGSSSGSAAAVAGRLVRAAIGTDTGGSIRSPAAYCGAVGLKPSFGRVPTAGVFPLSHSLDVVGPIAATVAEAALLLDAITEHVNSVASRSDQVIESPSARLGQGIEGLVIGYARDWFAQDPDVDSAMIAAMDEAVSQLSLLGARIEVIALPDYILLESAGAVILQAEALEVHRDLLRERAGDYGTLALQNLVAGVCLSPDDVVAARAVGRAFTQHLETEILSRVDALVTVTTLGTARPFADFDGQRGVWTPMRTLPFNLSGQPALAVPIALLNGLPAGMQIIGKMFGEAQICRIGHAFEQATDFTALRPPEFLRSAA